MTDPDEPGDLFSSQETPSYAAALAELEAIVAELDGEAVDVDHLSTRVQRASELLVVLRRRIGTARMEVDRVVASLEAIDEA
ncbi:exodeoxyribonuclease VII small subunit [Actinomarinicola tropica]|uniref:Exonuclease VII small subunit n=1 Tax=Actinomarinicola tropica TaxID=2789776 RepID=A0A5Q2RQ88_9ACTN|nr:exodeoxyribonuclease VII small subunit [Actinomarinicola tropica]QGG96606.1 exonuclease VII small subunit [Actinomarinicola tropica]